jgi:hypothetical protein
MLGVTQAEASRTRFSRMTADGKIVWRTEFIGPPPSRRTEELVDAKPPEYTDPKPSEVREPQAFLVEQEAGATVAPHFHYVDQFQVIVSGDGILGRHPVSPLTVHFAGAHTGYGPIIPGDNGLSYFTFRASADETGAQYLPTASARMRKGQRRNLVAEHLPLSSPADLASRQHNAAVVGLEAEDGLSVQLLRIAPGSSMQLPSFSLGSGVSMLVAAGEVMFDGKHYGTWSCLYARPNEISPELAAGVDGAEVLFLRYPRHAPTS